MIRPSGELRNVVETIRQRTTEEFIVEEPRGEPIRKVGRPKKGEPEAKKKEVKEAKPPKVEKVEVPVMPKQPEMKIAGADFSRDEAKDVRQKLSEETKLSNPILNVVIRILQEGNKAVNRLWKAKATTRTNIRNIAAGLALVGQVSGLSDKQRLRARNLARLVGAGAIARTSMPKFSRSPEDFDDDGNIRAEALKDAREGKKAPKPREAPQPMPDIDRARGDIDRLIDTMEGATNEQVQQLEAQSGMNVQNVIEDLKAQSAEIGQTNQLTQSQQRLAQMARVENIGEFLLAVSAIAVSLGLRGGRTQQREQPRPEQPRPTPPTRPVERPTERPPPERPAERPALPPPAEETAKKPEKTPIFTAKQIQIVEQQNETKQPQQTRPDVIIPAQKVLDPYKDEKDQKADFEIEAGFGFDLPFAMNGVILEDNALMQQHLLEEELIYRNAGIDRGNNDFDDPAEVGFEKPGNPNAVPDLKFEENYQDKPVNPNNTFKQNIMYNTMTPVLDQRGQGESLRESTLFGEQPTF